MNEGMFMALRAEMAETNGLYKQMLAEVQRMNELLEHGPKKREWTGGYDDTYTVFNKPKGIVPDEFITGTEFPAGAVGAVTVETVETVDAPPSPVEVMEKADHGDWTVTVEDKQKTAAKPAKKSNPKPAKPHPHTPGG